MLVWNFPIISPSQEEKKKKKQIVKTFKECGLSIIVQCNLKSEDFLDLTFDLYNNVYKPYRKSDNKLTIQSSPKCSKTVAKIDCKKNIRYFIKQR